MKRIACLLSIAVLAGCTTAGAPASAPPSASATQPSPSPSPSPVAQPTPSTDQSSEAFGYTMAFIAVVDGIRQVFVLGPDGQSVQVSTITDERFGAESATWSPDGAWLAYARGIFEVWLVRADGSDEHLLLKGHNPSWSADGTQLVFSSPGNPDVDINLTSYDSNLVDVVDGQVASDPYFIGGRPIWTPDGLRVLAQIPGDPPTIGLAPPWSQDVAPLQITRASASLYWSPDFTRLAFVADGPCGTFGCPVLGVANADGSEDHEISGDSEPFHGGIPSWSPDSRLVAYAAGAPAPEPAHIGIVTADGQRVTVAEIGLAEVNDAGFAWASDSQAVALVVGSVESPEIVLCRIADGSVTTLTAGSGPAFAPALQD